MRPHPAKHAGLGITLYGLRSDRNWGVGDFRDLRDLIDWAVPDAARGFHRAQSAARHPQSPPVQHQPLSAEQHLLPQFHLSRCGRRARLRPHTHATSKTPKPARIGAAARIADRRIRAGRRPETPRARTHLRQPIPPGPDCEQWIAGEGDLLRLYATYCALDEHLHAAESRSLGLARLARTNTAIPPARPSREFAAEHEREILFHGWLQWLSTGSSPRVQQHARDGAA